MTLALKAASTLTRGINVPLESATFISQLNAANPTSSDLKSEGDDQLRLLKSVLQSQFPNLGATAVTPTAAQLNNVANASLRAGDTYTGTHDFTGAVINVPTASASDNDNSAASTAMVQSAILASSGITASLPAQAGNAGRFLQTNGTSASWGASSLALLATISPTVAANVDFLNTFTSGYDNYLILVDGVKPAADDSLYMRLANSGVADSSTVYYTGATDVAAQITAATAHTQLTNTVLAAGAGACASISILNANDATNVKQLVSFASYQFSGTPGFWNYGKATTYNKASAVSGFRLYWNGASNFSASGRVRVYGYNNA
jgi:hypothetical protein